MKQLTKLILNDMRPALGVTEPAAIAFAVATAKIHVTGIFGMSLAGLVIQSISSKG